MAYIVGKDSEDKRNPMSLFADPGSFRNIKQQMQQEQLSQTTQPVFQGPAQPNEDEQKQRFQEGDIVEIEGEGAAAGYKPKQVQQTSGQFTNIQDYLEANRGRSAAIGERVAGQFEEEAGGIESERAATEKQYLGGPEGVGGYYGTGAQSFIDQSIAGAGSQDISGEDTERFKQLRTGGYGAGDFREQITEAQKLEKRASELGSSQGRFAAIRKSLGPRLQSSRRGGGRLDQAILGSDRRTQSDMARRAKEATQNLSEDVSSLQKQISSKRLEFMQTASTQSKAELDKLYGQLDSKMAERKEELGSARLAATDYRLSESGRSTQADAQEAERQRRIIEQYQSKFLPAKQRQLADYRRTGTYGTFSPEEQKARQDWAGEYHRQLGDYGIRYAPTATAAPDIQRYLSSVPLTRASVATPEQFARERALEQLSGISAQGEFSQLNEQQLGGQALKNPYLDARSYLASLRQYYRSGGGETGQIGTTRGISGNIGLTRGIGP